MQHVMHIQVVNILTGYDIDFAFQSEYRVPSAAKRSRWVCVSSGKYLIISSIVFSVMCDSF